MIRYCEEYWNDVSMVNGIIPNLENLYRKNILITGASGMICSTIVDLLFWLNREKDADIYIYLAGRDKERMQSRFPYAEKSSFEFIYYDATKEQRINVQSDFIIHGAGNANPRAYMRQPVETMLANIGGLNSLLSMARNIGTQRVLYISSSEVYGNIPGVKQYKENDYGFVDILNMRASYPCAKRAAESLCIAYKNEYNLDTVIVRPGHIYGPSIISSDTRASAEFTRSIARGEDVVMKSYGTQLRSYCYTLDCASAILTVLLNGKSGNAYNISNKKSVCTISDIAKALAKSTGKKVIFQNAEEMEKKGYNLMNNSSLNSKKLEELGWRGLFDLNAGTECTVKYYYEFL